MTHPVPLSPSDITAICGLLFEKPVTIERIHHKAFRLDADTATERGKLLGTENDMVLLEKRTYIPHNGTFTLCIPFHTIVAIHLQE